MIFRIIFRFIRLFSLDIVAGAIAGLVFASTVMGADLHRSYYIIMGLTVWLIYTVDHLMDGAKSHGKSDSDTHNFFYTYKIPIILVFLILLVLDFRLIVYRLDEKIIQFGMGPGIATVIYLLMNRFYDDAPKWIFIKELWIAVIYTLAIWGGPVILGGDAMSKSQILLMVSHGLIIFGNVMIYSIYERESDIRQDNKSFVRDFGLRPAVNMVVMTLALSILTAISAYLFYGTQLIYSLPLVLISTSMLLIISFPRTFSRNKLYGVIADLLLLVLLFVYPG